MRHRSRRSVAEWRNAVFSAPTLRDNVRVLLIFLADHMSADLRVSIPRGTIAARLGKSERRITERVAAAHDAGFLTTVAAGRNGRTAVYQGVFPDPSSGTHDRPLPTRAAGRMTAPYRVPVAGRSLAPYEGADDRPLAERDQGAVMCPTSTTADLSVATHHRDGPSADGGDRAAAQAGGRGPGADDDEFSSFTATHASGDPQGRSR